MALTRDFKQTVKARADRDPAFREALLTEAVEHLIAGKVDVGKAVLRDYINATVGFARLAKATGTPSKSLMRMLGPKGNPRANNLLPMIGKLQRVSGVRLAVGTGTKRVTSPRRGGRIASSDAIRVRGTLRESERVESPLTRSLRCASASTFPLRGEVRGSRFDLNPLRSKRRSFRGVFLLTARVTRGVAHKHRLRINGSLTGIPNHASICTLYPCNPELGNAVAAFMEQRW
jgi:DNA-binding phage protein